MHWNRARNPQANAVVSDRLTRVYGALIPTNRLPSFHWAAARIEAVSGHVNRCRSLNDSLLISEYDLATSDAHAERVRAALAEADVRVTYLRYDAPVDDCQVDQKEASAYAKADSRA